MLPHFLPEQVAAFRRHHPEVTFAVHLRDRGQAEAALQDQSADLAIVLEPFDLGSFETVLAVRQPVWCLMRETHPLAAQETIRLEDCLRHPVALPEAAYGVRFLMDRGAMRRMFGANRVIEADSFEFLRGIAAHEDVLTFHIPISLPQVLPPGLTCRPLDPRDVQEGELSVGHLRHRSLPVAVASFMDQVCAALSARFSRRESLPERSGYR